MYNYNDTKTYNIYQLLKDKYYIHKISGEVRWLPKQTGYYEPIDYETFLWHCWETHVNYRIRQGYEKVK